MQDLSALFYLFFLFKFIPGDQKTKVGRKLLALRLFIKAREKAGSLAPEDSVFGDSHNSLLA